MPQLDCRTNQASLWARRSGRIACPCFGGAEASKVGSPYKARELGRPFADSRQLRAIRMMKEAQARKVMDQPAESPPRSRKRSAARGLIPAISPPTSSMRFRYVADVT